MNAGRDHVVVRKGLRAIFFFGACRKNDPLAEIDEL
jgi:hypothetical protein